MTDRELIRFIYPRENFDVEITWLLSNYLDIVIKECVQTGKVLTVKGILGWLRERLLRSRDEKSWEYHFNS